MKDLISRLRSFGGFKNEMQICDEAANAIESLVKECDSWVTQCNDRIDDALMFAGQRDDLLSACIKTVEENGHLADGDDCTLIHLVKAIAKAKGEA